MSTEAAPIHVGAAGGAHSSAHAGAHVPKDTLPKLALAALGIVYGDIGTSPLYTIKECFAPGHGVEPTPANVLGILSLIFWALMLVITVKYITFVMRADNGGEGGILSLLALAIKEKGDEVGVPRPVAGAAVLMMFGMCGASLLLGEGIITPAISVLSAVEGLDVATPVFHPYIMPITMAILVALFLAQKRGTAGVGAVFGPVTLVWFICIGTAGMGWIIRCPQVLYAVDPRHAIGFLHHHGRHGFLLLGSVVLCITGGEALVADMGHFGKLPIKLAWFSVVLPALLLNYFGQGALLLTHGGETAIRANPFFGLFSGWIVYPMVVVATAATVVASQALISGAYSLAQQAVRLGLLPRMRIIHTAGNAEGQIYVPDVNNFLMVACLALVLGFRESSRLAAAYGIAVTLTMSITSILFYQIMKRWDWSVWVRVPLTGLFLTVDLTFFSANVVKLMDGGYIPVMIALVFLTGMTTWRKGRKRLAEYFTRNTLPLDLFLGDVERSLPHRVPGTAVFLTANATGAPPVLLHYFKHTKSLHARLVLLTVETLHVPEVPRDERLKVAEDLGHGFLRVVAGYGFMQTPDVKDVLQLVQLQFPDVDVEGASFVLGRETLVVTDSPGMTMGRKRLFAAMARSAEPANSTFSIPPGRVVELGAQVEI